MGQRAARAQALCKRTRFAKQWAQNGIVQSGFASFVVKKYSFSLRNTMDALASRGVPVRGSKSAAVWSRFMSSDFVVAKIGADPR